MKKAGIYKISSKQFPERTYIGSSVYLNRRKSEHFKQLRIGKHINSKMQNHANKYGLDDLVFEVIEYVEKIDNIIKTEQKYLDVENTYFNTCKIAGSTAGIKQSKEIIEHRASFLRGKKYSQEIKDRMSNANRESKKIPFITDCYKLLKGYAHKIESTGGYRHIYQCIFCGHEYSLLLKDAIKGMCKCVKSVKELKKHNQKKTGQELFWYQNKHIMGAKWLDMELFIAETQEHFKSPKIVSRIYSNLPFSKCNIKSIGLCANNKRIDNTSGYAGVTYDNASNQYRARVKRKGKLYDAGRYNCPTAAYIGRLIYISNNQHIA
jgi:group I intron endonuclease